MAGDLELTIDSIQTRTWQARIPVEIRLSPSESRTFDNSEAYLVSQLPGGHKFFCVTARNGELNASVYTPAANTEPW